MQQQQQQTVRYALPSLLPPGRDRSEAIAQLRRLKFAIKISDMYSDESALFCHVHLPKGAIPYLPCMSQQHQQQQQHAQQDAANGGQQQGPQMQLTPEQVQELGIEMNPPGVWKHLTSFFSEPQVLLFRAEQDEYFEARERMREQKRQSSQQQLHPGSRSASSEDDADASSEMFVIDDPREHVCM